MTAPPDHLLSAEHMVSTGTRGRCVFWGRLGCHDLGEPGGMFTPDAARAFDRLTAAADRLDRAGAALAEMLGDDDPHVRLKAAQGLAQLAGQTAQLYPLLTDPAASLGRQLAQRGRRGGVWC